MLRQARKNTSQNEIELAVLGNSKWLDPGSFVWYNEGCFIGIKYMNDKVIVSGVFWIRDCTRSLPKLTRLFSPNSVCYESLVKSGRWLFVSTPPATAFPSFAHHPDNSRNFSLILGNGRTLGLR